MAHLNGIEMGAVRKRAPEAFAVAGGALLAAFPLIRPWGDKAGGPADMVDAFASPMWVAAHVAGMGGFVFLAAAVVAWRRRHDANAGGIPWWVASGVALMLPFFGAETFGLHVIAGSAPQGQAIAAANAIREGTVQLTMFAAGLLLIAVGAVLLARRDRSATLLSFALVTYLPQFFVAPQLRVAHGVVLFAGAAWWAWSLVRTPRPALAPPQNSMVGEAMLLTRQ